MRARDRIPSSLRASLACIVEKQQEWHSQLNWKVKTYTQGCLLPSMCIMHQVYLHTHTHTPWRGEEGWAYIKCAQGFFLSLFSRQLSVSTAHGICSALHTPESWWGGLAMQKPGIHCAQTLYFCISNLSIWMMIFTGFLGMHFPWTPRDNYNEVSIKFVLLTPTASMDRWSQRSHFFMNSRSTSTHLTKEKTAEHSSPKLLWHSCHGWTNPEREARRKGSPSSKAFLGQLPGTHDPKLLQNRTAYIETQRSKDGHERRCLTLGHGESHIQTGISKRYLWEEGKIE